jgi:hypothetical protein
MMNYELFDILNAGYKTMRANAEKLDECAKAIAECILDAKNQYIHVLQCDDRTAAKLMSLCDAQRYEEMFAHGSTEYRAVAAMIGAENAENAAYIWRNAPRYTYQQYIWRRSFRTKKYIEAYFGKSFDVLFGFITGIAAGFSVERYIEERSKGGKAVAFANERYYVPAVLSAYLEGDRTRADGLFERLRGIVNDEAGHGTLTREIIMGLLMSNRDDAHELVASLFIAARLQEGLRQSIMEAVDECDVKAFMLIFKTVMDNNLSRYSSVVRAFCVWIGIDLDVSAPKKVKGALETAYRCLTNETFRRECVNGENPIDTIIALWATSFDGIEYAEELVRRMLRDGPRHKKLAGLFFASGLQQSTLQYRLASECLYNPEDRKDNEIMAWVLRCLGGVAAVELAENPHVFYSRSNVLRVPAAELKRLYYTLKELVETFGEKNKKGVVFENSVIEGFRAEYSRDGLLSRMAALLSAPHAAILNYHHSNRDDIPDHPLEVVGEMRDDLCGYAEKMDTDTRGRLIHHVVAKGATPVQRAALIAALGYRSEWNVKAAWKHVENLPLTDEEILQLEGFLRFKNGKMRQYIFLKLLAQEPEKLGASISRLLADRDKMRVAAGEELLTLLAKKKGEAKYEGIYANLISSPIPRHTESSASGANAGNDKLPKTAKEEPISPAWDRTDGYGLFDPASPVRKFKIPSLPDGFDLAEVYALDLDRVQTFYDAFDAAFHAHRDYEYEGSFLYCYDSPNGKVLLGERERIVPLKAAKVFDRNGLSLDEYPLADLWRTTLAAAGADGAFLYRLHTLHRIRRTIRIDDEKTGRLDELSGVDDLLACARDADAILNKAVYGCKTYDLLPILRKEFSGDEIFRLAYDLWRWFLSLVGTHGKREFVNFDDNWIIDDIEALDMTGEQFV